MREREFWDLVDQARGAADGDMRRLADHIRGRLSALPPADIEDFARFWWASMDAAYRWPVWDAAIVWLGWFGDDSFRDFRGWLISRGRTTFEKVFADPDTLADEADDRESPPWPSPNPSQPNGRRQPTLRLSTAPVARRS